MAQVCVGVGVGGGGDEEVEGFLAQMREGGWSNRGITLPSLPLLPTQHPSPSPSHTLQKKYHELFVSAGGLGVLKSWLEPYGDGSLPNARVRSAVLRACQVRGETGGG